MTSPSRPVIGCRDFVYDALVAAMARRGDDLSWIDREREVVAVAANQWAAAHGCERRLTVADVERVEVLAVGHVDYGPKLALHVAEFVTGANR